MRTILILISTFLFLSLTACSAYKIDIQQGNTIEADKLNQLKAGMSKQQVQFLMGTAMLIDPFHPQRWEYVYSFRKGGEDIMKRKRVTLTFKDGVLAKIDKSQFKEKTFN
ncbi:hypothetical protein MNBD_GAMMA23-1214 [hydrothermal vent metagenome]|uniref:Outer membrane protein assembly factor BamE domain-containing protein n=1 Tax=hydrothermal vent metagenome TaxID=652676 RepID=A0A3B1AT87_9ZZZZ